jgi:hypothetical protein
MAPEFDAGDLPACVDRCSEYRCTLIDEAEQLIQPDASCASSVARFANRQEPLLKNER